MDPTTTAGQGTGTGEVHARVTNQPSKGQGMSGKYDLDDATSTGAQDGIADRATGTLNQARDRVDDLRGRAGDMASQARERVDDLKSRAADTLNRTGISNVTDTYPLVALGAAFGFGYLLAGRSKTRAGAMLTGQLRGVLMAGLVAGLKDEARAFIEEQARGFTGGGSAQGGARGGNRSGGHTGDY